MKLRYEYWTKTSGIGGKIIKPEDFIVKEIISSKFLRQFVRSIKGIKPMQGRHSLFLLKKKNLTTPEAVKQISKILKIKEQDIGYAGLKDKFAVTYQYVTIRGRHKSFKEKNLELSFIKMIDKQLSPGELINNKFIITLHNCKSIKSLENLIKELEDRGLPNYFGMQRFGINKNNHVIGRHLAKKEFSAALRLINKNYRHQYKIIESVPKALLKFFINAYQSFLFNEALSKYIKKNRKPSFRSAELKPVSVPELRLSCRGGPRKLFISAKDISFIRAGNGVKISFKLPKGSYATVLLREISKNYMSGRRNR